MRTAEEYEKEFRERDFHPSVDELNTEARTATLSVTEHASLTFDDLQVVAEVFGTKTINLGSETREVGGCESCAFTINTVLIHVKDITR